MQVPYFVHQNFLSGETGRGGGGGGGENAAVCNGRTTTSVD